MRATGINKLLKRTLVIALCLFAADRAAGWWLQRAFYRQLHGDDLVSIYTIEKAREDLIILGGSKASHNYRAPDIERLTGLSTFDGGRDNMDVLYTNAIFHLLAERYTPKVLLLDMTYLDLADYGEGRRVNIQRTSTALLPFAQRYPQLYPIVQLADKWEPVKAAVSHVYPFNSLVGSIVQNTYTHFGHTSVKGYEPLYGRIDSATYKTPIWGTRIDNDPVNAHCLASLREILRLARERHVRLIVMVSPFYFESHFYGTPGYLRLRQEVAEAGFEFYDHSGDPAFMKHPQLFDDDVHLNDSGAAIFSRVIADIIRQPPATVR